MISLLGNPNALANLNTPAEGFAPTVKPPAETVPVNSQPSWWRTLFNPAPLLERPQGDNVPVAAEIAQSFEPWDYRGHQFDRLDGSYAVLARPGVDPNLVGGQASWDLYPAAIPRTDPVPWDLTSGGF